MKPHPQREPHHLAAREPLPMAWIKGSFQRRRRRARRAGTHPRCGERQLLRRESVLQPKADSGFNSMSKVFPVIFALIPLVAVIGAVVSCP
jgi:hypothetical protein